MIYAFGKHDMTPSQNVVIELTRVILSLSMMGYCLCCATNSDRLGIDSVKWPAGGGVLMT